jgi:DNA mismatch repair enzyme (predicted ATPase)
MKIKVLPENIAGKIAAGEVIQRPASAVKELMENSIDAGATEIELIVINSGRTLIRVIDNGEGMSEEDALISVLKHATSKIKDESDLDAITTLGFRGEALSSMIAVSKFEMKTGTDPAKLSAILKIDDSRTIVKEVGGYFKGTDISVKNLFYNTPARRNFLKTDSTELKHIIDVFQKLALSRNNISFRMFSDEALIHDFPAASLEDRLIQFLVKKLKIIPFLWKNGLITSVYQILGKPA